MAVEKRKKAFCLSLCNHWSYIGIGWQLGLESSALAVTDALEMADREPGVKTALNLDAYAYEQLAEKFPEIVQKLKKHLNAGTIELIGGTFSQPMSHIGGESTIRQLVYGREAIRKVLGYEVVTFLEEEECLHPQLPQILVGAGYQYASLAQVDTWGKAGVPSLDLNVFLWKGTDGTTIPSMPKNPLFIRLRDLDRFHSLIPDESIGKLRELGEPLVVCWSELPWETPQMYEEPAYVSEPKRFQRLSTECEVEYVTPREYMEKHGHRPKETLYLNLDAWRKVTCWGLGGDQLRIMDRKVEGMLLAAEKFEAIGASLGSEPREGALEAAWKDLLICQSHDVSMCEYSSWQEESLPPRNLLESFHGLSWGSIGWNYLLSAERQAEFSLRSSLAYIVSRIDSQSSSGGRAVVVFNPVGWERTGVARTGRVSLPDQNGSNVVVRNRSDCVVPSQLIKSEKDGQGNRIVDVAFLAERAPSVGYDTYYLEVVPGAPPDVTSDLRVDEQRLALENGCVKVALSPVHGALVSLINKRTNREMLDGRTSPFPVFTGRPNSDFPLRSWHLRYYGGRYSEKELEAPALFDSAQSKAEIRWVEKGPLRATVKASHSWPLLRFETYVTLVAGSPRVDVMTRVLAHVPPAVDATNEEGRFSHEIKEGYWHSFAPSFQPSSVLRDFAFAIETTSKDAFEALTLVDLLDPEGGFLLLHAGTQYFTRDEKGIFSNLVMREWESHWTGQYGWPRYAEYRYALLPHEAGFTHAERMRASAEFARHLTAVVASAEQGSLPHQTSFIRVDPENVMLSAFRKKDSCTFELRVAEVGGQESTATVKLDLPVRTAVETNLLGGAERPMPLTRGRLSFRIQPWRIRTFALRV
jgi:hypothetical protein